MRIHLQRVKTAKVEVKGEVHGEISHGLLLLVGFARDDTHQHFSRMADKVCNMRVFTNEQGRFDRSVLEVEGSILAVPQFTLYADCKKGRRPDFFGAMEPQQASLLFDNFVHSLQALCPRVQTGVFGAEMEVSLLNHGPVTILLDSDELFGPAK